MAILRWNFIPQAPTGIFTAVPDHYNKDVSDSAAHDSPQPTFIDFSKHKTPSFIIFQDILRFGWQQSISEFWQAFHMLSNLS